MCSDLWKSYRNVRSDRAPKTLKFLDRYYVMATMNKQVDMLCIEETQQLKQDGYEPILLRSCRRMLKPPENPAAEQMAGYTHC